MEQGMYGVVKTMTYKGKECVYKTSRCIDHSIELECSVIRRLEALNSSHYPRLYKRELTKNGQYGMIMEYVGDKRLSSFYRGKLTMYKSLQRRALLAAAIFNEELGITHNDLHTGNIMVRDVEHDVDRYVFPDGKVYEFRTYNKEPVIIDFGLAYDGSLRTTAGLTDCGIFPFEHDPLSDARRLYPKKFPELRLLESGCFERNTFVDLSCSLIRLMTGSTDSPISEPTIQSESDGESDIDSDGESSSKTPAETYHDFIDLFVSKAQLTEEKPIHTKKEYYKTQLSKSFTSFYRVWSKVEHFFNSYNSKMAFLKTVIDHTPFTTHVRYGKVPIERIQVLKYVCNNIVGVVQDLINLTATRFSQEKQQKYKATKYKKARDLIRQCRILSKQNEEKLLVRSYDVKIRTTTFYHV